MHSFTVTPVFLAIGPLGITLIVIAAILVAVTIIFAILGRKAQKRQAEQQQQIDAVAQTYTMLIIDKKKLKLKDAGLPSSVTANTPWYSRRAKAPVVKAKVGPKVMTFVCDPEVFDMIPLHKEVKAKVSGLYISEVKGTHGTHITPPEKKKKNLGAWARRKLKEQEAGK